MAVEVRVPKFPECWESCGSCASGDFVITEVRVASGDVVGPEDVALVIESQKTSIELPVGRRGRVIDVALTPGDELVEGALMLRLERI